MHQLHVYGKRFVFGGQPIELPITQSAATRHAFLGQDIRWFYLQESSEFDALLLNDRRDPGIISRQTEIPEIEPGAHATPQQRIFPLGFRCLPHAGRHPMHGHGAVKSYQ